ncbi:MAG: hypothetical protein AAB152_02825 [Candidatus Coatesbacteria bacterium]
MIPRTVGGRGFALALAVALAAGAPAAGRGASTQALLGSARSAGLGADAAAGGGIAGLQGNPAALASQTGWAAAGTYLSWLEGARIGQLTACAPTPAGPVALSIGSFTAGSVDVVEDSGAVRTVNAQQDTVVTATLARSIVPGFEAGVAGTWYRSVLAETWVASAASVGLGARFVTADGALSLGGVVANAVGTPLRYAGQPQALPRTVTAGAAWRPVRSRLVGLLLAVDYVAAPGDADAQRLGVEAEFVRLLALRAGVTRGGGVASVSAGLGARWGRVQFDYAVASPSRLGTASRATVTVAL